MPATPSSCNVCLTSSSLNGLTIAVTSFMVTPPHRQTMPSRKSASPGVTNDTRAALPNAPPEYLTTVPAGYCVDLQRVRPPLAGADADEIVNRRRPDLAVADLPGCGRLDDDVHYVRGVVISHDDVEAHLGHEVHLVLRTAVDLRVALLPAIAVHLRHGQTVHAEGFQRRLHVVELERLDDRGDESHAPTSVATSAVRLMGAPCPREGKPLVATPDPQS